MTFYHSTKKMFAKIMAISASRLLVTFIVLLIALYISHYVHNTSFKLTFVVFDKIINHAVVNCLAKYKINT